MKLKAAITTGAPEAFVKEVDSPEFANRVFQDVLVGHLSVQGEWGPAEFYVQASDHTVARGNGFGCRVKLSGVSVIPERTPDHFENALKVLFSLYAEAIRQTTSDLDRIQLFVSIMLDSPTWFAGKVTTLLEHGPAWVRGKMTSLPVITPDDWFKSNPTTP